MKRLALDTNETEIGKEGGDSVNNTSIANDKNPLVTPNAEHHNQDKGKRKIQPASDSLAIRRPSFIERFGFGKKQIDKYYLNKMSLKFKPNECLDPMMKSHEAFYQLSDNKEMNDVQRIELYESMSEEQKKQQAETARILF